MSTWQDRSLGINDIPLSDNQRAFLKEFIVKFNKNTKSSKAFAQEYRGVLADSKTASGFRSLMKEIFTLL